MKTETLTQTNVMIMVLIAIGVAVAAYGEVNFVVIGVVEQLSALVFEAARPAPPASLRFAYACSSQTCDGTSSSQAGARGGWVAGAVDAGAGAHEPAGVSAQPHPVAVLRVASLLRLPRCALPGARGAAHAGSLHLDAAPLARCPRLLCTPGVSATVRAAVLWAAGNAASCLRAAGTRAGQTLVHPSPPRPGIW